jgi:hypothetical protein
LDRCFYVFRVLPLAILRFFEACLLASTRHTECGPATGRNVPSGPGTF